MYFDIWFFFQFNNWLEFLIIPSFWASFTRFFHSFLSSPLRLHVSNFQMTTTTTTTKTMMMKKAAEKRYVKNKTSHKSSPLYASKKRRFLGFLKYFHRNDRFICWNNYLNLNKIIKIENMHGSFSKKKIFFLRWEKYNNGKRKKASMREGEKE